MKNKNWFWGVFLVLAGVVVIASQVTGFSTLGFWSVLAAVLLVAALIQSIIRLNMTGILLSAALLYIIFQKPLQWFYIQPWLLILAAVLGGIGLTMLIRPRRWRTRHAHNVGAGWSQGGAGGPGANDMGQAMSVEESGEEDWPVVSVSFGGNSRYLHSPALRGGTFSASFGALEVYFTQAQLAESGADIVVDCSFGSIKLYVPRHWHVTDNVSVSLGAMQNERQKAAYQPDNPQLRITGDVSLGAVEVEYV